MRHRHKGTYPSKTPTGRRTRKNRPIHRHRYNPMRPRHAKKLPRKNNRIYEPKYDGTRIKLAKMDSKIRLINRRQVDKTSLYPELKNVYKSIRPKRIELDTELAILTKKEPYGSFEELSKRDRLKDKEKIAERSRKAPATLIAFDVISKEHEDKPLRQRKEVLDWAVKDGERIREIEYTDNLEKLEKKVKKAKGEGVIAKSLESSYKEGKETKDWIKKKFVKEADVVITGATPGTGKRKKTFGALKASVLDKGKIREVANVGTGFTEEKLRDITKKLRKKEKLFARIKYRKVGSGGKLVEPRFVALRTDITAKNTHI